MKIGLLNQQGFDIRYEHTTKGVIFEVREEGILLFKSKCNSIDKCYNKFMKWIAIEE